MKKRRKTLSFLSCFFYVKLIIMMNNLDYIKDYIKKNNLISPKEKVGVAVSGGADSVYLLHALISLRETFGFSVVVLHFEHGIRGKASQRDLDFVRRLCKKYTLDFISENANTRDYAKEKGLSLEQAARALRYDFFERTAQTNGLDKIALAHHRGDQAETILLNLTRGCGMQGLLGMQPFRSPYYIRPLLETTKDEVLKALKAEGLKYQKDKTNGDTAYSRNRIRKKVLPELKKINLNAEQNMQRTAAALVAEDAYLTYVATKELKARTVEKNGEIYLTLDGWETVHLAIKRRAIRQLLNEYFSLIDVEFIHIDSIIGISLAESGRRTSVPHDITVSKAYDSICFYRDKPAITEAVKLHLGAEEDFELQSMALSVSWPEKAVLEQNVECLDADCLENAVFRAPMPNDYIVPLGMTGKKRLSDYLSDRKIPLHQRKNLIVLATDDMVWMVAGVGINERVRITDQTRRVCRIAYRSL